MLEGIPIEILYVYIAIGIAMLVFFVYRSRKRGDISVLVLNPNQSYKWSFPSISGDEIELNNKKEEWNPKFKPKHIFTEEKSRLKFWRLPSRIIVIPRGAREPLAFANPNKEDIGELQYWWTKAEIAEWIKKQLLKAKVQARLISPTQFLILVIFLSAIFLILLLIANRVGAF